jgi:DNA-binding transcriptional LysR family regulator
MERTEAMRIYLRVAELTSFSRAADSLGLPKASVSQAVQQLENLTGVRLLQRTTRRVSLTQDGMAFYERCRDLVSDLDELEGMFKIGSELSGRLRVDLPSRLARSLIIPRLPELLEQHPKLELELSTTDRKVDIILEGFDCVVRAGFAADPGVIARPIGQVEVVNCASAGYIERYGRPEALEDLHEHHLVHYATVLGARPGGFEYFDGQSYRQVAMHGWVTVNNSDAYHHACRAGLGIIQVPRIGVQTDLDDRTLVEVLPELRSEPMQIALLYPHRRHLSGRLKAFIDWLEALVPDYLSGEGSSP